VQPRLFGGEGIENVVGELADHAALKLGDAVGDGRAIVSAVSGVTAIVLE